MKYLLFILFLATSVVFAGANDESRKLANADGTNEICGKVSKLYSGSTNPDKLAPPIIQGVGIKDKLGSETILLFAEGNQNAHILILQAGLINPQTEICVRYEYIKSYRIKTITAVMATNQ